MKIFIINAGEEFGESKGDLNRTITSWTKDFFEQKGDEVRITNIIEPYNSEEEVEKFIWADLVFYHTPVWWFAVPFNFKRYIDHVFSAGIGTGMLKSDGRSSANPKRNYGKGGLLHGRKYVLTTTWNAPLEAFTLPDEFFGQTDVDSGVMYGFHRMNAFTGLEGLQSYHFHDVHKDPRFDEYAEGYKAHLEKLFA